MSDQSYDAFLLVSFGGPEGMSDVMPFLRNVLRGRNVPESRMKEVAHHYELFDGVSPINEQNRKLIAALESEFKAAGIDLPIYWGNRNWHPMLAETIEKMKEDGVKRALAFVTAAYCSYSSCKQYSDNIDQARAETGDGAPAIDRLRLFFNHPGFVEANAERLKEALLEIPEERRSKACVAFTAHSIPSSMATEFKYVEQLEDVCRLVFEGQGAGEYQLVFQSRSGPPSQPWLEPDICDHLMTLSNRGVKDVIVHPVGFISDHMEVKYDLDTEARSVAKTMGLNFVRAGTVGTHPAFVACIRDLVLERLQGAAREAVGKFPASPDRCPEECLEATCSLKR